MVKRNKIIDKDLEQEILIFYKTNSTAITCEHFNITPDRLFQLLLKNNVEKHDAATNRKLTNISKFGVDNPAKLDCKKEKAKQTTLARHGSTNYRNHEKANATRVQNSGSLEKSHTQALKKQQQTNIKKYGVASYFAADDFQAKARETNITRYGVANYRQSAEYTEKYTKTCLDKYSVEHYSQTADYQNKVKETCLERYGAESWFASNSGKSIVQLSSLAKYGVTNPMQSDLVKDRLRSSFLRINGVENPMQDATLRSKQARAAKTSKLEQDVAQFLIQHDQIIQLHYVLKNDTCIHEFDIALFEDNKLKAVVDCDGVYYHGYLDDYNGKSVNPVADEYRMLLVSNAVDLIVVSENNYETILTEYLNPINYSATIFNWCRSISFPYPIINNPEASYKALCKADCDKFTMNSRIGMRVVDAYHRSIWHARRNGFLSPFEAWQDDNLLKKCIDNRLIYIGNELDPSKVLYGFSTAKIAPKVSVFNPYLAKYLIDKYLSEFETIFDPCSGYSGRMLGCCSLNKQYIGQDINPLVVDESNNIIDAFNLTASVTCEDSLRSEDVTQYDCLFTCTPYSDKEQWQVNKYNLSCDAWITKLLQRYKCKKYLFVVDSTERYKDCIVETLTNKSHLSINNEYVVLLDSTQL